MLVERWPRPRGRRGPQDSARGSPRVTIVSRTQELRCRTSIHPGQIAHGRSARVDDPRIFHCVSHAGIRVTLLRMGIPPSVEWDARLLPYISSRQYAAIAKRGHLALSWRATRHRSCSEYQGSNPGNIAPHRFPSKRRPGHARPSLHIRSPSIRSAHKKGSRPTRKVVTGGKAARERPRTSTDIDAIASLTVLSMADNGEFTAPDHLCSVQMPPRVWLRHASLFGEWRTRDVARRTSTVDRLFPQC
jgi:hypothetical protein